MIFRRQESFRYTFNKPIDCLFKIIKVDDLPINTDFGKGQIIDISPSGLKMMTLLNLTTSLKKIDVEVHFTIDNSPYEVPGVIQWQKKEFSKGQYSYGIKLEINEETASKIVDGLKKHAENYMKSKKFK